MHFFIRFREQGRAAAHDFVVAHVEKKAVILSSETKIIHGKWLFSQKKCQKVCVCTIFVVPLQHIWKNDIMNDLVPIQMRKFENEIMFNFPPPPMSRMGIV